MGNNKMVAYIFVSMMIFAAAIFSGAVVADTSQDKVIVLSLVNQDPDPAAAGDVVELRIGVENQGGASDKKLMVEIKPSYPFEAVTGENLSQSAGTMGSYQQGSDIKILKYKVRVNKDATAGSYELDVLEYNEGEKEKAIGHILNVDIRSRESAEIIHIDKTMLVPGKQTSLKFSINNVGNSPLRELSFNWENEDNVILPVGSDNTRYVKYIEIGESAEVEYQVIADTNADAGLYKLNLYLKYEDPSNGSSKTISTIAGVYVGGGTDFDVAFSESSSGQTSFTIANIGSNPATSVSVTIPQQQGWSTSGSNSVIIGNLNTGDYTVASFSLQSSQMGMGPGQSQKNQTKTAVQNGSAGQQAAGTQTTLKIQVAYTDTMGTRELVDKEVKMNPQALASATSTDSTASQISSTGTPRFGRMQQQSFFSKYKWYLAVLIVLIVAGLGYWKYRKEKILNPSFRPRDLFNKRLYFKKKKK